MYSKMAEEEDNKMATHLQKDADGVRVFVRSFVPVHHAAQPNGYIGWTILCHCCAISLSVDPRSQTQVPRHLRVLPRGNLSTSR